ncbi:MAG: DUF4124 domain-containing protein [Proteobacteria bacterium]|nr:DUF4124 domain-containing protein [Pseudomonadota bacterium]
MRRITWLLALLLLTLAAANALAADKTRDRYRWTDAQGVVHFDDVLSDAAIQAGYDVVNGNGMRLRHVARPMTAEEAKAEEKIQAQKKAADKVAADQARDDAQLLAAYPTEQMLSEAHQAQLAMIDQYIQATQISLQSQEKSLTDNLTHAADLERTGKPVPANLRAQIESLRANIEKQKAYIVAKQQEKVDNAAKFDAELAHYRQISDKPATKP